MSALCVVSSLLCVPDSTHQLLATVVDDGRHKVGGFADHAELLRPSVVNGDLGHLRLRLRYNNAFLDQLLKRVVDECFMEAVATGLEAWAHGRQQSTYPSSHLLVRGLEQRRQLLKGRRDDCAGGLEARILGVGSLLVALGEGTGVAELDVGREHAGAGADAPRNQGLLYLAPLDGLSDLPLLRAADLSDENAMRAQEQS